MRSNQTSSLTSLFTVLRAQLGRLFLRYSCCIKRCCSNCSKRCCQQQLKQQGYIYIYGGAAAAAPPYKSLLLPSCVYAVYECTGCCLFYFHLFSRSVWRSPRQYKCCVLYLKAGSRTDIWLFIMFKYFIIILKCFTPYPFLFNRYSRAVYRLLSPSRRQPQSCYKLQI